MKLSFSKGLGAIAIAALLAGTANAQVLINEFDTNQFATEYIELYNAGGSAVDLAAGGYVLVFLNGSDDLTYQATDLTGTIAPGGYFVIAETGVVDISGYTPDQNGTWTSFQNGVDGIALLSGASAADYANDTDYTLALAAGSDVQEDAVLYGGADAELETIFGFASGFFIPDSSAGATERITDGQGGSSYATTDWQIDAFTAGGSNAVVVTATTVGDIAAALAEADGTEVIISGTVVSTIDEESLNGGRNQFFIQDSSGVDGQSAILIDDSGNTISALVTAGQTIVNIQGTMNTFSGTRQLVPTVDVTPGATVALPAPLVVTAGITVFDDIESELIRVNNVTFDDGDGIATFTLNANFLFTEAPDTIITLARIEDQALSFDTVVIPNTAIDVCGIAGEFSGTYQIFPRTTADLIIGSSVSNWEVFD